MVHQLCQIRGETACTEEDCNSGPSGHPLNCEAASAREDWSSAAHDSFEGRPVVRPPEQLRLHPAMQELDLIDIVDELNKATEVTGRLAVEPILLPRAVVSIRLRNSLYTIRVAWECQSLSSESSVTM